MDLELCLLSVSNGKETTLYSLGVERTVRIQPQACCFMRALCTVRLPLEAVPVASAAGANDNQNRTTPH